MKKTKLVLLLGVILLSGSLFVSPANAELKWLTCTVTQVGPAGTGRVNIRLTDNDGTFSNRWFATLGGRETVQLAIALTALSNGIDVRVYTDPDLPSIAERVIYTIYVGTI